MMLRTRLGRLERLISSPRRVGRVFCIGGSAGHTSEDLTAFMAEQGIERLETDQVIFLCGVEPVGRKDADYLPLAWIGAAPVEART